MLFTQPQNEFKLLEDRELRGEPVALEPGYKEAYQTWVDENKAVLHKLSSEERTISFSDHLEETVLKKQSEWIESKVADPSKKKQLLIQAQRGDLLLVSTDEGKHFDQVLTLEEAHLKNPLTLSVLSSTLRSTTPNFQEVKEEQNMLHIIKKLRDQHFLVERAYVEKHVVHVDAIHPRRGNYEVQVPLNQDATLPFEYSFLNQLGVQKVQETQLPEEYGEASQDHSLERPSTSEIMSQHLLRAGASGEHGQGDLAHKAFISTMLPFLASNKNMSTQALHKRANSAADQTRLQMKFPGNNLNVMASKAAMGARKARQNKQMKEELDRQNEREEKYKREAPLAHKKREEEKQKKLQESKDSQVQMKKKAAAGAGALAGIMASAGGMTFFIAHLAQ